MANDRLRDALMTARVTHEELADELGVPLVFTAVIGRHIAHFHEHLLPRHPSVPAEVPWHESDEAGPQADAEEVAELAERLAARLEAMA